MGSGGCDFHEKSRQDCIHCLGWELALARAEVARLYDWIAHLVKSQDGMTDAAQSCDRLGCTRYLASIKVQSGGVIRQ